MAADGYSSSLRIQRSRPSAATRNVSARASIFSPEEQQYYHNNSSSLRNPSAASSHGLRSYNSRYSLNEQFAATRQEYEFDDDASSIYERMTLASEAPLDEEADADTGDETVIINRGGGAMSGLDPFEETDVPAPRPPGLGDCYDILCLPRDVALNRDQIRSAYFRFFLLFYPGIYPENLQLLAQRPFERVQLAFETLINPGRRAVFDLNRSGGALEDDGEDDVDSLEYESAFRSALLRHAEDELSTMSDVHVRPAMGSAALPSRTGVEPLNITLSHSVALGLPALRRHMQRSMAQVLPLLGSSGPQPIVDTPTLTLSGGVGGLIDDMPTTFAVGRHHASLLPLSASSRPSFIRLVEHKLLPTLSLRFRQQISNPPWRKAVRARAAAAATEHAAGKPLPALPEHHAGHWESTTLDLETGLLPTPSLAARVTQAVTIPGANHPSFIDASVHSTSSSSMPRLSLGARHTLSRGTAFARLSTGNWSLFPPAETCRQLSAFSKVSRVLSLLHADAALAHVPGSVEVGFSTADRERNPCSSYSPHSSFLLHPRENGIRALDAAASPSHAGAGSWTASATASSAALAASLRCTKDLATSRDTRALPLLEVELCASTLSNWTQLALRNLWSVGRFSRAGLEVGLGASSLHVSLYWSRLNQRISLPVVVCPSTSLSASIAFWAGVVPFAAVTGLQFLSASRRNTRRTRKPKRDGDGDPESSRLSPAQISAITHDRLEADNVTVLLSQIVDARQRRQASLGGLVVMSAKYGVKDEQGGWAGEEVADVTVALAALVDDAGNLEIPAGLRKGNLPGFWDPAPGDEKVLHVRYSWKGRVAVVEAKGTQELILPP